MIFVNIYLSICRGRQLFEKLKLLASEEEDVNFQDWTYKFCLIRNVKSKSKQQENQNLEDFKRKGNCIITMNEEIPLQNKFFETGSEYVALATLLLTSIHVVRVDNKIGPFVPIISHTEKAFEKLAGKGAALISPGVNFDNPDELARKSYEEVKKQKNPANSLDVWVLWHPQQAEAIRNITFSNGEEKEEATRYLIQGAYGTGKTNILCFSAIKAVNQQKKVCFWSMLDEKHCPFNRYIKHLCISKKIHFISGSSNIEEKMERIRLDQYDVLLVDEVKVTEDPTFRYDQASDGILR